MRVMKAQQNHKKKYSGYIYGVITKNKKQKNNK